MNRDTICVQGGYTPGNGEPPIVHEMRRNFKIITPDLHILHKISSIVPAR